jgi:pimeloyl-ACP methyl ester carboxylesterase
MSEVKHHTVATNGINMHYAELGTGLTVLLLHGFPEFWYSWRYQIPALAAAGFRVIAPDLRGSGRTDAPASSNQYSSMHLVGDIIGLLDALGEEKVFVAAHDWGASLGWDLCLFRPDRVRAYAALSVPFMPRVPGGSLVQTLREILGEGFYIVRFQEPGRAERDFARTGTKKSLQKMLYSEVSELWIAPEDQELMESLPLPSKRPHWFSEFDIEYYTEEKEHSGWTGGLNWYRAIDLSHELKAPWTGVGVTTRSLFIAGDKDMVLKFPGNQEYVDGGMFKRDVPNLEDVVMLEGGHFIQQEQGEKVNKLLIAFFKDHK